MPRVGSVTTCAPARRATSAVSSVLPLSTTMISSGSRVCTPKASRQRASMIESLSAGMTTEMTAMTLILPAQGCGPPGGAPGEDSQPMARIAAERTDGSRR